MGCKSCGNYRPHYQMFPDAGPGPAGQASTNTTVGNVSLTAVVLLFGLVGGFLWWDGQQDGMTKQVYNRKRSRAR